MSAREAARRTTIWATTAGFVAVAVAMLMVRGDPFLLLGWSGFPIVGALILTARPGNNVGRALLAVGAMWLIAAAAIIPVQTFGQELPHLALAVLSTVGGIAGFLAFLPLVLVVIVFPSGRIQTTGGRVILWFVVAYAAVLVAATVLLPATSDMERLSSPWAIDGLAPLAAPVNTLLNLMLPVPIAAALIELSLRWRRAVGAERLQYRWLAYGAGVVLVTFVVDQLLQNFAPAIYASITPFSWLVLLLINAIPVTIWIAVTRHGLFEINRVVSRTFAYSIVTAGAIGVYAIVVTSVTWLIPDAPSIAVAAATLIAAALFLPLLRRVQRAVDRRFDRERYDAARVVDEFGERLRAEVDTAATTNDLLHAVEKALQPASLGVWTREAVR